jgi:hypothetical protein
MAETFIYPRPNSAQGFYSANDVFRVMPTNVIQSTTPAAAAALPQVAAVVQEFTSADRYAVDCVCGGTIKKIGDTYGWLMKDEKVSTAAAYAISGEMRCLQDAASVPAVGADAYIIAASCLVTHDSAGNEYIGKFSSVALTNPTGLPAGTYADVILMQSEL